MAKQLEKSQWRAYFDRMFKALVGKRAEIEVVSLKLDDQIEAEWFGCSVFPTIQRTTSSRLHLRE
jgi:hypothetical protein